MLPRATSAQHLAAEQTLRQRLAAMFSAQESEAEMLDIEAHYHAFLRPPAAIDANAPVANSAGWAAQHPLTEALDAAMAVEVTDADGRIVYCNPRFCDLSGYAKTELIGANHRLMKSGRHDAGFFTDLHQTIASGAVWRGAICNRRPDGSEYWTETSIVPHLGSDGRPRAYIVLRTEISDHVAAHEALAQALDAAQGAAAAKERFAANLSHELRTPLTGIAGFADLLADTPLNPLQADYVTQIRGAAEALKTVVNDVLTFAQTRTDTVVVDLMPTDLRKVVERVSRMVEVQAQAKGVTFACTIDPHLPELVSTDPFRLSQVLTNLLGNAIKFTDQGRVELAVDWKTGRLRCDVEDTGHGFAQADKDQLFRAFEMPADAEGAAAGGFGLGLAISAGLVRALGGSLDVEAEVGQGAHFWFEVPCPEELTRPAPAAEPAPSAEPTGPKRVLVVEDNPMNQRILRDILERVGHSVTIAGDGEEGVQTLRAQRFDLVIMDLRMPRLTGQQAIARIRADADRAVRRTPVIALSADVVDAQRAALADLGFDAFLSKPIELPRLLAAIDHWSEREHAFNQGPTPH